MWGTIGLAIFSGADFIDAIIKVFLENVKPKNIDKFYKTGYYFRWFFPGDIMSILKNKKLNLFMKIKELLLTTKKPVSYQIMNSNDFRPIFTTFMFSMFRKKN